MGNKKNWPTITSKSYVDECNNLFMDVTVSDNGVVMEKRLTIEDYLDLLKSNIVLQKSWLSLKRIPDTMYHLRVCAEEPDTYEAVLVYKATKRQFFFCERQFILPFPALIAKIVVKEEKRRDVYLYALDRDKITDDSPLYNYPFGNVSADGKCCYGNIVANKTPIHEVEKILDDFLLGETNGDLFYDGKVKKYTKQTDLVSSLQKLNVFPQKLLNKNGKTVKDLFQS